MKKIALILFFVVLTSITIYSQVPEKFNYQAVIRNSSSELVTNQDVDIKVIILDETSNGTVLYSEEHAVSTNAYGQVAIQIGDGIFVSGNFSSIDWGVNDKFLNIEVDAGSGFTDLGTVQLLTVPYALYADITDSANIAATAHTAYISDVALTSYIADSAKIAATAYTAYFADSTNIAATAYTAYTADVLGSDGVYSTSTDTLFVVKDHSGNVVFAVFPDGAQLIVNESAKGSVGGFAVSGRSPSKVVDVDILKVTLDSTRIYVNDTVTAKGSVGGFAVSGRSPSKGFSNDYLLITGDSTRVYINDTTNTKGKVGGFAVSGRSPSKGTSQQILVLNVDSTRIFTRDTIKGFGVMSSKDGNLLSYLQISPNNYFIGHDVAPNITTGVRNSVLGYNAGYSLGGGDDNIFIGNKAGYKTGVGSIGGNENVFIGNEAGYNTTTPVRNVFIGHHAGRENIVGQYNLYVGNAAGENGKGYYNTVLGGLAASNNNFGNSNVVIGYVAGNNMISSNNVFIGMAAGNNSEGDSCVFIGCRAGMNEHGSQKLYISNSSTSNPLIYGDFKAGEVTINGDLFYTGAFGHSSDVRLKTNLVNIESGLKMIQSLNGYYFDWNEMAINDFEYPERKQIGFVAQELEELIPELVSTGPNGYKSVDYSKITPVLVEAIKEQQQIIEEQKDKISNLEERLTEIEKLLMAK